MCEGELGVLRDGRLTGSPVLHFNVYPLNTFKPCLSTMAFFFFHGIVFPFSTDILGLWYLHNSAMLQIYQLLSTLMQPCCSSKWLALRERARLG